MDTIRVRVSGTASVGELVAHRHLLEGQRGGPATGGRAGGRRSCRHLVAGADLTHHLASEPGQLGAGRARAGARSACPTGSSGGSGTRCRPPSRRGGAGWRARPAGPASAENQAATLTARSASSPLSSRQAACQHRDPDGLGVDGGVGRPEHGALEGGQGPAELLPRVEVLRRLGHRRLGHPHLEGAQPGPGPVEHPEQHVVAGRSGRRRPARRRRPPPRRRGGGGDGSRGWWSSARSM